jgi:uncharacterized membrane protein
MVEMLAQPVIETYSTLYLLLSWMRFISMVSAFLVSINAIQGQSHVQVMVSQDTNDSWATP